MSRVKFAFKVFVKTASLKGADAEDEKSANFSVWHTKIRFCVLSLFLAENYQSIKSFFRFYDG